MAWNALEGALNFFLNLSIVVAPFGQEAFNQQVAQVNAITRIALLLPNFVAFGVAFWLVFRALYRELYRAIPSEQARPPGEADIWELIRLREAHAP
jgi:hypothetical protein